MPNIVEQRMRELNISLPDPSKAAANYTPYVISGKTIFIAGQLPIDNGKVSIVGKLGTDLSIADGQEAARHCALNLLAQAKAATDGDLSRISRCIKIGGFVNSSPTFTQHAEVMNGASDLICKILENSGVHARFAVGAVSLPFNAAVEVDGIFELL